MDRETNLDSILVLEKRIEEHRGHEGIVIQLKRARNSLLNVSTLLPPEILGSVFCWNAVPDGDFGGLPKGSYNFLLVCHHWFKVASCTPGLWSFWGNSVEDWTHRYARCGTSPLDLVLDLDSQYSHLELNDQLRGALRDRATRDAIQQIHLRVHLGGQPILSSIISSIVVEGEGTQLKCVESLRVQNNDGPYVDVSAFFSRYRLPKLRDLRLSGCNISSWDLLKPQTTVLTTLELTARGVSPFPTMCQLLSILASNPLLQRVVSFCNRDTNIAISDEHLSQVPLRRLKRLHLTGDSCTTFQLLHRLELPDKMDNLTLYLYEFSPLDLSQNLGPYFGNRLRRHGGFPGGGLGLFVHHDPTFFSIRVGDIYKGDDLSEAGLFAEIYAATSTQLQVEEADRLCFDLVSTIPWEQVVGLQTTLPVLRSEKLCVRMCNLTCLRLVAVDLSMCFLDPEVCGPHTFGELLPGLDSIVVAWPTLSGGDWSPLTNFLSRRAVVGNMVSFLGFTDHPHMGEDVVESIRRTVKVFRGERGIAGGGTLQ